MIIVRSGNSEIIEIAPGFLQSIPPYRAAAVSWQHHVVQGTEQHNRRSVRLVWPLNSLYDSQCLFHPDMESVLSAKLFIASFI